jgi:hypothetical protein
MKIHSSFNWFIAIVLVLFSFNALTSYAQDTLITKNKLEVRATNRNGTLLKFKDLIAAAKAEELQEAVKYFKKARVYDVVGNVIGLPGAFLLGYSLGYGLTSPDGINGSMLLVGTGLVGLQYTMVATLRDPNIRKGINIYNDALYQKRLKAIQEDTQYKYASLNPEYAIKENLIEITQIGYTSSNKNGFWKFLRHNGS